MTANDDLIDYEEEEVDQIQPQLEKKDENKKVLYFVTQGNRMLINAKARLRCNRRAHTWESIKLAFEIFS